MKKFKLTIIIATLVIMNGCTGSSGIGGVNDEYKSRKCRSICRQSYNPQSEDTQERINHSKCYLNCMNK